MEATNQKVNFTHEEITQIRDITKKYSEMHKEAVRIQEELSQSSSRLSTLIKEMEEVKRTEYDLFMDLAVKKDLEPKTVAIAAANHILNEKA